MKPFFVYMLRCSDGSYYVGHTDELERRIGQHQAGEIEGYTKEHGPVEFVWSQETATREEALAAESRIKGWGRAKKEALIRGDWEAIQRHAWGTRNPLPERLRKDGAGASIPQPGPSIPQGERIGDAQVQDKRVQGEQVQGERVGSERDQVLISQPEWVVESGRKTSIPQSERARGGSPRESNLQFVRAEIPKPATVRPEVSKGRAEVSKPHSLASQILARNRRALAKAITLIESTRTDHRAEADQFLDALLPHTGNAMRLGISGVPGVGKSTFIETLGLTLIQQGHRVAVLAIDPSSSISGGSILGDKTRMERLSVSEQAYIRPSPASGTLGGVAEKTREAMLVCEAAGHDVVIVETVGVGQSETAVAGMTDLFVLLQLPNAGDDLQAIKRGVMELADIVVINKADIDPDAATRAEATVMSAQRLFSAHGSPGRGSPTVMQVSALKGQGIEHFWSQAQQLHNRRRESGELEARRRKQALAWMWDLIHARLQNDFRRHPAVRAALHEMLREVADARTAPSSAARRLLGLFERPEAGDL